LRVNVDFKTLAVDLASEGNFSIGAMSVRPSTREVKLSARSIVLEPRVMQVLVTLARFRGEVVSRETLILACWQGRTVGDDAINRCIAVIRKLESDGGFTIVTIARVGYRLNEIVGMGGAAVAAQTASAIATTASASLPPAVSQTPVLSPDPMPKAARRRGALIVAGALSALVMVAAATYRFYVGTAKPATISVAVLPFDALNGGGQAQGYATSISAALVDRIGEIPLAVLSPTRSFEYSGSSKARAYKELPSTFIIDGTVRSDNGTLRVTVHLDNRESGETLYSQTFEAPEDDALGLTQRAAAGTTDLMRTLSMIDPRKPDQARQMMAFWAAFRNGDMNTGYELARELAEDSPDRGELQVNLALTAAYSVPAVPLAQRRERFEVAKAAVERASRTVPREPLLFLARNAQTPPADWAEREAVLRQGMRIDSGNSYILDELGGDLMWAGRLREARPYLAGAAAHDRGSIWKTFGLLADLRLLREWKGASDLVQRDRQLATRPMEIGILTYAAFAIAADSGQFDAARQMLDSPTGQLIEPPDVPQLNHAILAARVNEDAAAIAHATAQCRRPENEPLQWMLCILFFAETKQNDDAFALAARVFPDLRGATLAERENTWFAAMDMVNLQGFSMPVLFDLRTRPMRADPRFIDVAERLGLVSYWRTNGPPDFCTTESAAPICVALSSESNPRGPNAPN